MSYKMPTPIDNLTAVLYGINDMRLEQRPIPVPNDNQVLLRIEVVGICGSDVHYLVNGRIGPFIVEKPMVIGHEASGTVIQIGKNVKKLKVDDRVAIEPGITCRICNYCKSGNYHQCDKMVFCATPPIDGNLTRYYIHDADFCHKLPDNMSLEDGALMEPLSVGVHACKRANVRIGSIVLILGAGPIGLVSLLTAKAMGASKVIMIDMSEHRLDKAKQLGADDVLKITNAMDELEIIGKIKTLLNNDEPTITLEATGAEQCVRIAVQITKAAGTIILIGIGKPEMTIPLNSAFIIKEVDIRGVFRYNNDYPIAIEMVRTGKVNVKPLITHHFKIEDTVNAFNIAKSGEGNPIKILIHTNADWQAEI